MSDFSFDTDVLSRSQTIPLLVDFWAAWCGPCRTLGPVLERLAEEEAAFAEPRWELVKIDTEAYPEIADRFGIRSIPTVLLFVDGEPIDGFAGALSESMVREWLEKALPNEHDKALIEGGRLMATGELEEGRTVVAAVLAAEPGNQLAQLLMAQSYLGEDPEKAVDYIKGIRDDSDLYERAEAIRIMARLIGIVRDPASLPESPAREPLLSGARHALAGEQERALVDFIASIRLDRSYADELARRACLALFRILGDDHPITQAHRREFDGALY